MDYCITSHQHLGIFTDFTITLTSDLIIAFDSIVNITPDGIPDHWLLSWNIVINLEYEGSLDANSVSSHVNLDLENVPNIFLMISLLRKI